MLSASEWVKRTPRTASSVLTHKRKSKDEITEAVCYSSTSSLYDLRNKALVRFALLYFGAGAMPSM